MTATPFWSAATISRRIFVGLQIGLLGVAVGEHLLVALPRIVATHAGARDWIAFSIMLAIGVICGIQLAFGSIVTGTPRWVSVALLLVTAIVITPVLPLDVGQRGAHWYLSQAAWFALVLLLDLPVWVPIGVIVAGGVWFVVQYVIDVGSSAAGVAELVSMVVGLVLQCGVAASVPLSRRIGREAEAAAESARQVAIAGEVAERLHADHERRYNEHLVDTVPLLTGLADGSLDPNAPEVRRRCAMEAARMRLLFAERDSVTDPLVHELRAGIDVAERRGVTVELAVRGQECDVPAPIRRGLLEPVLAEVVSARSKARVTVLRLRGQVRVSAYGDHGDRVGGRSDVDGVDVYEVTRDGWVWTEAVWKPAT